MIAAFWAAAGVLLILAEFIVPQFVVFFFGLGALANALLVALVPGFVDRVPLQILTWALLSGASLAGLRRYGAKWFRGDSSQPSDEDLGRTAQVTETIAPDAPGRIQFRGTTWVASSYDETIEPGATVTILDKQNLTYIVTTDDLLGSSTQEESN